MRRPLCMVCLLFVVTIFLCVCLAPPKQEELSRAEGEIVYLAGKIYHKEIRPSYSGEEQSVIYLNHIAVSGESEFLFEQKENIQGVMCYMQKNTEIPMGSIVAVKGKLQQFNHATNPGEFDSRQYYQILKLDFRLKEVEIVKISEDYHKMNEVLYRIREKCSRILESYYDEVDAGIMKTILLGDKNSLSEEVEEQYKRNGIIHIMAISGLHISMLGMGLYKLLKKCRTPLWLSGIVTVLFIWCYGIMTGMSASANRAIVMFVMKIAADMIGRTYDLLTALAVAAVLILIEQPLYVMHCGFLLSFGAVMGIGVVLPILEEDAPKRLPNGLLSGIAVFLISFPIQIYYYYQYPIYSIVLNLLIIPLMTFVMISGLLMLGMGAMPISFLTEVLGKGAVFVGHIILKIYAFLCGVTESLPGSVFITGKPKEWQMIVYYLLLCVFLVWKRYGKRVVQGVQQKLQKAMMQNNQQKRIQLLLSIMRVFVLGMGFLILLVRVQKGIEVTFLDVGQGDCIYIRSETGKDYLIDGGSTNKSKVGEYQITPFLKSKGVSCLEAVFVTHGDKDHYSGIEELLEETKSDRIRITRLVLPETERGSGDDVEVRMKEKDKLLTVEKMEVMAKREVGEEVKEGLKEEIKEGCDRLEILARQQGIEVVYIKSGDLITDGKMQMECLNPVSDMEKSVGQADAAVQKPEDKNEQSIVLYLTYGEFSALFTGDVTGEPEQILSEKMRQKMRGKSLTVLKVAHHGSMYSTDEEFLERVRPQVAVISCGEDNSYGHPHEETLERLESAGSRILTTPEHGAISVKYRQKVEIRSWLKHD